MKYPRFFVGGVMVLIFFFIGFWFYVKWDLKKFEESLPTLPPRTGEPQAERLEKNPPSGEVVNGSRKQHRKSIAPEAPTPEKESTLADAEKDMFLDDVQQITETPVTSEDAPDIPNEDANNILYDIPYDMQITKAGFEDYNTYLSTHPEYAYQRLDDAFREQFGDDPDVDILIESIRSYNNGPVPVDMAIRFMEAELRLISNSGIPTELVSEVVWQLEQDLEMLQELKQYALESGEEILYRSQVRIEGGY